MNLTTPKTYFSPFYPHVFFLLILASIMPIHATVGVCIALPQMRKDSVIMNSRYLLSTTVKKPDYGIRYTYFELSMSDLVNSKKKYTPEFCSRIQECMTKHNNISKPQFELALNSGEKVLEKLHAMADVFEKHGLVNSDLSKLKLPLNYKALIDDLKHIPCLDKEQKDSLDTLEHSLKHKSRPEVVMGALLSYFQSWKFPFGVAVDSKRVRIFDQGGANSRFMEFNNPKKVKFNQDQPSPNITKTFYLEDIIRSKPFLFTKCKHVSSWWGTMLQYYPHLYDVRISFQPFDTHVDDMYQSMLKSYQQQNNIKSTKKLKPHFIRKFTYSHTIDQIKDYLQQEYTRIGCSFDTKYIHLYLLITPGKNKKKPTIKDISEEQNLLLDVLKKHHLHTSDNISFMYALLYFPLLFKA